MDEGDVVKRTLVKSHELYDVFEEDWLSHWEDKPSDDTITMTVARNKGGNYIGDPSMAEALCGKHGIAPECRDPDVACAFGWSEKKQKYFGWSHRALVGFSIGDKVFDADCDEGLPFIERGKVDIKDKDDARLAAMRFAEYIG